MNQSTENRDYIIVVAEDSPTQAAKLEFLLSEKGYKVIIAVNGQHAMLEILEHKPNLIISDIIMPEQDGFGLCSSIKNNSSLKQIPIILLTTLSETESILKALDAGADYFFTKPYDEDHLLTKVEHILKKQSDTEEVPDLMPVGEEELPLAKREQMINLLVSTYEHIKLQNQKLYGAQKEIKDLNEHLNEKVLEKTADLQIVIDELIKVESELSTSEERFKQVVDSAEDWIWEVDNTGLFTYSSSMVEKLLGYTPEEIVGKYHFFDFFTEETRENQKKFTFDIFETRQTIKGFINENKKKNGEIIIIETNGTPVLDDQGNLKYYRGVDSDITDRIYREKANHAMLGIAQEAFNSSDLFDLYQAVHKYIGEVMYVGNFYISIFDEANNLLTFPYFTDETDQNPGVREFSNGITEYVLTTGKSLFCDEQTNNYLHNNNLIDYVGTPCAIWMGVPLILNGKSIGVMAVQHYTDANRYKKRDLELLEYVSTQVATVIQKKMSEAELVQAKEKAEESNRLKTSLLANMSHELRTPMNGILGFSSLLNDTLDDPHQKMMADSVLRSANRLMETLNSIMDLSQLQADKTMLKYENACLNEEILKILENHREMAEAAGIELKSSLGNNVICDIDTTIFRRIIQLLLDNAIKFTEKGSATISLKTETTSEITQAIITVSDTGIGIASEYLEVIFDEFRQVSSGFGRYYEGNGLGLTLCRKFLKLLNGQISVKSTPGKGSDFTITFPLTNFSQTSVYIENDQAENNQIISNTEIAGKSLPKVLIVEDNELNTQLLEIYLEGIYETFSTNTGESAISVSKETLFDLILMDINLGSGLNGMEAASEIRKIADYDKIPIIAVTGYTSREEQINITSGGCSHYLAKPFRKSELLKIIEEVIGN
jgi:PAS domain S-box-containing protein